MTPESLKACPFCGGRPTLTEWKDSKKVTENGHVCPEVWFVGCNCFFVKYFAHHGTKQEAIDKWNTRALLPAMEELRDAIVKAIKAVQEPAAPGGSNYITGYRDGALWKQEQLESIITTQFASFMAQKKGE